MTGFSKKRLKRTLKKKIIKTKKNNRFRRKQLKLTGGGYYKDQRLDLDRGINSIFSRVGRNVTDKYIQIYDRSGMSPEYKEYSINAKHKRNVLNHRKHLKENFNPVGIVLQDIIDDYNLYGLDQGAEGACSFVGFLNLVLINGLENIILNDDVLSNWQRYWNSFNKDTATDIGETLDDMFEYGCIKDEAVQNINYVPMRSENNNENYHNIQFWSDNIKGICDYFKISEREYKSLPWLFQQAYYIESLLNRGIPVEINAREHSRTCIAHNDNYLLFADNWGHSGYQQGWNDESEDFFFAGFSTVNKWAVYSHVRDLAWLNDNESNNNNRSNMNNGSNNNNGSNYNNTCIEHNDCDEQSLCNEENQCVSCMGDDGHGGEWMHAGVSEIPVDGEVPQKCYDMDTNQTPTYNMN